MDYKQIYKSESSDSDCIMGIEIRVASPIGRSEGVKRAAYKAAELLEQAITRDFYANNKEAQERARVERLDLISCFAETPIFVQAIPNGYCNRACCEHKPWFRVTSRIGIVNVGWRKHVIVVDWSDSTVAANAEELFAGESVTKNGRMIHAWSYEKAREYINVLFEA